MTNRARLRLAVSFAQRDLTEPESVDVAAVTAELLKFCEPGGRLVNRYVARPDPEPDGNLSLYALRRLQADVRAQLTSVVDMCDLGRGKRDLPFAPASVELRGKHTLAVYPTHIALFTSGSLRDQFLLVLMLILSDETPDRVRRCPECSSLFVREKARVYCSRACVNKVNWRDASAKPGFRKRRAKQARKRYAKKIATKHPKAKVSSRTPKKRAKP